MAKDASIMIKVRTLVVRVSWVIQMGLYNYKVLAYEERGRKMRTREV